MFESFHGEGDSNDFKIRVALEGAGVGQGWAWSTEPEGFLVRGDQVTFGWLRL